LDADLDVDAAADDVADGIVNGEAVGDVAAGAVDVERDRARILGRQLAEPFDTESRGILLDVAYEVDVAQPFDRLFSQLRTNCIDQLGDQAIAQLTHHGWIISR